MKETAVRHRIISTQGIELWSQSLGNAEHPALLLIAGDCQSAMNWPDEFVRELTAAGLHVLRYDHRDTGRSTIREFTDYPYDFDDLAADALAVLDGWGFASAHVVGMGMGAALAQLIALDQPKRLTRMTLLGAHALDIDFVGNWQRALTGEPTPDGLPTPRRWFVEMGMRPAPAHDRESALDRAVADSQAMSGDQLPFDAEEFRRWEARAMDHAGRIESYEVHPHGQIRQSLTTRGSELAGIGTATLVIQAPLDPISPPPHGQHLADSIPGARLVEIPGMGHALPSAVHKPLADAIIRS